MSGRSKAGREAGARPSAAAPSPSDEPRDLEDLFRGAPVAMGLVSGRVLLEVNQAFEAMTGHAANDLRGKTTRVLYSSEEEFERVGVETERQLRENGSCTLDTSWRNAEGKILDVEIRSSPIDANDPSLGLTFAAIDITRRKSAEEGLQESVIEQERLSKLLQSLFDAIPDVIGVQDLEHRIIRYNQAGYDLLGLDHDEVVGRKCFELIGNSAPCDCCATARVYETKEPALTERYFEPRRMWLECRSYPVFDKEGRLVRIIEHLRDISDRKHADTERLRMERQIQQAQKMESLGVLAGGIAHDFNNILMTVMGNAELARIKLPPGSPGQESIQEIITAVQRASELCRQMLAYAGQSSFKTQPVDLGAIIEEMGHLLKTSISKKAILNIRVASGLPRIMADPSQIRQVVMNLIINASDAIGDRSGVITVNVGATRCDEDYLRKTELQNDLEPGLYIHIEVSDTGCGMDAKTRSRIFDPFFTTKFTGRGLGLAAAMGIIKSHKGALKVYSEVEKGTTFKLLFPALTSGSSVLEEVSGESTDWRGSGTVLLVDDEESLRAVGAEMLENLGFAVLLAENGREGLDIFRRNADEIAVVLLDLTMPKMDGAQAYEEIRRIRSDAKVVLASGYCKEETEARFAGKRLAGVIQKPYSIRDLREVLRGALETC